jgi:tetratricopeptide (TPR) repeat protein
VRRRGCLLLAGLVAAATAAASAQTSVRIVTRPEGAVARAGEWIDAVLYHDPGRRDPASSTVSLWSRPDVEGLLVELSSIRALMRDPSRKAFDFPIELDGGRPREIRYSRRERETLDRAAAAVQQAGLGEADLVARAIVLHSDIARLEGVAGDIFRFTDGQQFEREQTRADHWGMTRLLADTLNAKAGRNADLALWYRATLTYMASIQLWSAPHARRALERFDDDPDLHYVVGCLHERLAARGAQASIAASRLPGNLQIRVGSESDELDDAAAHLKRALDRNGRHSEARLHYGRVLTLMGKPAAAVIELRRAVAELKEPGQKYYAGLFLGAALEDARQPGEARLAYEAAAMLFPNAQAPRLALSALMASGRNREGAAQELAPLFTRSHDDRSDPWVTYLVSCGRNADALLAEASRRLTTPRR